MDDSVIAQRPPKDGREWDVQCARCGSSVLHDACYECGGDGFVCDEDDPDECVRCGTCDGGGSWANCGSGAAWCEAHPLPGRELVQHGELEWFVVEKGGDRG